MITTEDINKIRQQVTAKQINKGKITTDTIEGIRQQLAQRQAAQQPPIEQPVVQQPVQPTISQPNFANHASMSQQGHNQLEQKQATIDNNITKPMTSYLQNGGKIDINDTASLAQLAREQGVQDTNYLQGRQEALNQPKLQDQYKVLPGSTTSVKIPQRTVSNVDSYNTRYGTQEANDTIKNIKITNDNQNADVYMNAKAGLQEAQQNNDLRGIARNQAIIDAYKDKYKETYKGDKKTTNFTNLNNKLINYRQNIDKAQERFLNADEEHKTRYAKELQEAIDVFNRTLKIYQEAIAYDEVMNDNMLKDIGSSTKLGFLGGTAKIENGLYQLGTREAGLNADTIDVNGLLDYNSGANYNILDTADSLLNIGNPIKRAIPTLTGGKQSATQAINQLALIATTYPQIIKARDLYTKIATHTYEGTAEDLKKELDQIQKQIYQDFKDRFTQNTLNKEAEQLEHNRNVYGKFDFVPNAFNTTANMIPSMLLAPIGGEQLSLGAMAVGAGSQASDQALAEGANYNQAFDYGVLTGATEYATEKMFSSAANKALNIKAAIDPSKAAKKLIEDMGIKNTLARLSIVTTGEVGGEFVEEATAEAFNPVWKYITYDKNALPTDLETYGKEIVNAGMEAIPSTILMQGMGTATNIAKVSQVERGIIKSINESDLSPIVKNQLVDEVRKASKDVKLGLEENEYMQDKAYEKYANLSAQSEQMKQRIPEGYSLPQSTIDILSYTENNRPGLNIAFDTNIQGNGTFVENSDGTRTITLNPNSKRAVEFTLTHELGHDLKGTAEYEQLQNLLIDYAKGKPNYQKSLNALDKTYKESGANYNLQDEATNDMLGEAIGEQEFYNKLAENPTLFNRVTNGLKNLLGNKDTKLKNKIEKLTSNALKQEYKGNKQGVQNSISENVNAVNDYLTNNNFELDNQGRLSYQTLTNKQINSLASIYKKTGYEDVTPEYLKNALANNSLKIPREVADRFIEKELGYKPQYDTTKIFEDADGNPLTKEQVEFYKNSGVRDIRGRLIPVYHRTNADFTVFDNKAGKQHGNKYGKGFYFSITPENYGNNTMKVYLNAAEGEFKYIPSKGYYVVQEPNQIKNVDNTTPTSNPDIRYSLSEAETDDRTLAATHNLTEEKLRGVLELGGFPVPSIAISDVNKLTPTQFGDITVLFDKDTIDPASKKNEVYNRDIWSPTFPEIGYNISNAEIRKMMDENGIQFDSKDDLMQKVENRFFDADNLKHFIGYSTPHNAIADMKHNKYLKYLYAKTQQGLEPVYKTRDVSYNFSNNVLQKFNDYVGKDANYDINSDETVNKYQDKIIDFLIEEALEEDKIQKLDDHAKEVYKNMIEKAYRNNYSKLRDFVYDAYKLKRAIQEGNMTQVDENATFDKIDKEINQKDFEKWIDKTFGNFISQVEKGIRNDKDAITDTGRRTFKQLHDKYTLANVVKAMTKNRTVGGENTIFAGGWGKTQAHLSKKFKSIQDIRNSKKQLQTYEKINKVVKPLQEKFDNDYLKLAKYQKNFGEIGASDDTRIAVENFAERYPNQLTIENFKKILDENSYAFDSAKIPDKVLQPIIDDLEAMRDIPTDYFEAKPQRAVGFEEIASVLIPSDLAEDTKQQLRDRGIKFTEYDRNVEGDREAKYRQAAQDVLFSKSNSTWQQFLDDTYGKWNTGTRTNFTKTDTTMLPSNEELQEQESKGINAILKDLKIPTNEELQKTERESVKKEPIVQANKITSTKRLDDVRDFKKVGDRKVNAYQYDNPEIKPFFQQEAKNMLYDLNNVIKGERTATWDDYGELHYSGVTRETVQDIADLLDGKNGVKLSYADIEKGLNAIIEDKGSENIAAAKRIEMVLDKRLREGYTDSYGTEYEPNDNYLNFLAGKDFIDPAEYDKQVQDKLIADYEAENDDGTLFSLSEEEAKEVSDYVDKIYEDNTLDEDFRNKIIQEINKLANYDVFKDIKQEVKEYKEKNYGSIPEPTQPKPKTVKWTETAQKNELVRENVEEQKITYVPSSNKQQIAHANKQLEQMGYDDAKKYLDNKVRYNERITPTDIALGERLIQEAIKKGDINQAQELIADTAILGKDYGQVIQALSMISRMTPEGQLMYINKVVDRLNDKIDTKNEKRSENKKANNIEIDKELAGNILKATNEVELQNAVDAVLQNIADQMEVSLPDKIAEWRYLAMLANPRTHIRNSVANVGMKGLYGAKNQIQRAIETVAAPLLDERTRTYKKATADVKKFAEQSTKDLADILGGNDNKTIESRIKEMRKVFKNESLEKIRRFNSNMLSLEDNVFTQAAYKANLQEYLTANGIKTQHDIDMNPEIVQKGINFAKEEAWKTTFHQMSKAATAINRFENINGYTKLFAGGVIPFKKTPINIAKTGAAYSPLGLLDTLSTQTYKLKSGQITANQYIDRLSQGLTGSALFGIGALLAKMGILRAGTDKDDEYAEQIGQTKSYSVRLGDKNYDISWFAPSAMPLLMGAELVETTEGKEVTFSDIAETLASTINPLSEMSFVSGLNSSIRSYSSSDSPVDAIGAFGKNAAKSYFGQFVPTIGGQINKIIDKTERSTTATKDSPWKEGESFARQQINKIPGGSFLLEPKTDVWGNEKKRDSNVAVRAFDALINPGTVTKDQTTRVDKEIMELAKEADDTSIKPSIPKSYFTYNKEDVNLSAKDYTKYKKIYGQYMYNTYDALLDDEYYKSLEPAEKVKVLKNIATDSRNIAKNEVGYQTNEYFKYDTITDELEKNGIPLVDYYLIGRDIKMSDSKSKKKTAIAQTSESMNSKDKDRITSQDKKVLWDIFGIT